MASTTKCTAAHNPQQLSSMLAYTTHYCNYLITFLALCHLSSTQKLALEDVGVQQAGYGIDTRTSTEQQVHTTSRTAFHRGCRPTF